MAAVAQGTRGGGQPRQVGALGERQRLDVGETFANFGAGDDVGKAHDSTPPAAAARLRYDRTHPASGGITARRWKRSPRATGPPACVIRGWQNARDRRDCRYPTR